MLKQKEIFIFYILTKGIRLFKCIEIKKSIKEIIKQKKNKLSKFQKFQLIACLNVKFTAAIK